jgi:hypothetical protein
LDASQGRWDDFSESLLVLDKRDDAVASTEVRLGGLECSSTTGDSVDPSASPGWMTVPLILAGGTANAFSFWPICGEAAWGLGDGTALGAGGALALTVAGAGAGLGDGFEKTSKGDTKSKGDLLNGAVFFGAGLAVDSGTGATFGEFDPTA